MLLQKRLRAAGAVLVEGAKACGKTETARQVAKNEVLLDIDRSAREAAELNPGLVLEGDTPRLIDEWQLEPEIWNLLRNTSARWRPYSSSTISRRGSLTCARGIDSGAPPSGTSSIPRWPSQHLGESLTP